MTNWKYVIKGIPAINTKVNDGEISLKEGMLQIADKLKDTPFYNEEGNDFGSELFYLVDEMEYMANLPSDFEIEDYNYLLGQMYDWADCEKVWIDPGL